MQPFANSNNAVSPAPSSSQGAVAAPKPAAAPAKPPGTADVKPRLTKEQHDILERHFQTHHKPSTHTKKGFAETLGVPLDKINNWFQNRRAKVKQDMKKQFNQMNMQIPMFQQGMQGVPHIPMPNPQPPVTMGHHFPPQPQAQLSVAQGYYPVNADISPASLPVQGMDGPTALDLGPSQQQVMLPQFDMPLPLGSIPETDRGHMYNPNAVMHSFLAAASGPYTPNNMQNIANTNATMQQQSSNFAFRTDSPNGLPNDTQFLMSTDLYDAKDASNEDQYGGFGDYLRYMPFVTGDGPGSLSADDSPYSGAPSNETNTSSIEPATASVASLTSRYSGFTDIPNAANNKQENDTEDLFISPYNMPQASASDFWVGQGGMSIYQHSNASAHAVLSSPHQSGRSVSTGPTDFETPHFGDDLFTRRNSSTSNLANNMDAIHIQNCVTPEGLKSPTQTSIADRRHKRPTALNSNTLRSASYSGGMPSPGKGNNGDHTLRRIRSSGIAHASRVQKPQPGSAQRSPMSLTFSEAASSPKFQRTLSSSSVTTVGQNGSLAPPTPQTPNEIGRFPSWQSNVIIRPQSSLPDHSSPESFGSQFAMDQIYGESPPSFDVAQLHQTRLGEMYRDTPPQSAPATQQGFPRQNSMQPPQLRAGFHSSADLTLQQPKPSHARRPSLPVDAQGQINDPNAMYATGYGGLSYQDLNHVPLSSIQHNVPFAPRMGDIPDFLENQFHPESVHGHMRRTTAPEAKNYIFANQGPRDFRS